MLTENCFSDGKIDPDDLSYERRAYNPFKAYMQSKLANILFTKELAKRLEGILLVIFMLKAFKGILYTGSRVTVYTLHPGAVQTELGRYLPFLIGWVFHLFGLVFFKTPKQGAQTTLYCVLEPGLEKESGLYYRLGSRLLLYSKRLKNIYVRKLLGTAK